MYFLYRTYNIQIKNLRRFVEFDISVLPAVDTATKVVERRTVTEVGRRWSGGGGGVGKRRTF